jgi:hypothetical protein
MSTAVWERDEIFCSELLAAQKFLSERATKRA